MRVRLMTGVLLVLLLLIGPTSTGPVRSQAMCHRVAKALGMATQTFEAASKRWTDCLGTNGQCEMELLGARKAQDTLERTRAEAARQCPDLGK